MFDQRSAIFEASDENSKEFDKATDIYSQYVMMNNQLEKKQYLCEILRLYNEKQFNGETILAFSFRVLAENNSNDRSIEVRKMSVEDISSTI